MIRRPPRSTHTRSSAASDVYKRQVLIDLVDKYQRNAKEKYNKTSTKNTSPNVSEFTTPSIKEEVNTKLVFLPRDPEWAYVFWQISESDRDKAQSLGANKLCLRLYDASSIADGNLKQGTLREIAVDSYSTEWYLPIPLADRDYKVELGYKLSLIHI